MKTEVFAGSFKNKKDIANEFRIPLKTLNKLQIIYAVYEEPPYEGYADIFYLHVSTGMFYEVHGSHCSCYGLENQWKPELIGDLDMFLEYAERIKVYSGNDNYEEMPLSGIIF